MLKPNYSNIDDYEFYGSNLLTEYQQSVDEGLDVTEYKEVFDSVAKLPKNEIKKILADALFEVVKSAKPAGNYKYNEPSKLEDIKALRKEYKYKSNGVDKNTLENQIYGAWMGRICGCMLGKTVEGIRTDEFIPFLKETANYPLHRYIYRTDLKDDDFKKYRFPFAERPFADQIEYMPYDDDTNYVVLSQLIIENYGKDFTPYDVSRAWLYYQPKVAYYTAGRVAFVNFVKGFQPPVSAVYKNPYREWIGAQIRGDYYGYINPGNPELAAEMAWRDASVSHIKNGIYGEMFIAAMLAIAAVTNNIEDIILGGLAQIPCTSRLYESIMEIYSGCKNGISQKGSFQNIHEKWNEHTEYGWCHTIPNAMIVAASLLYGGSDYAKSICMAVETGFDTDCNGATVGSILGLASGIDTIPEYWTKPINNRLETTIFGVGTVDIKDRIKITLKHINNN